MPRLILHLGPSKTGTTSLQRALYTNRHALLRDGIFVPVFPVSKATESHHVLQALCKPDADIARYWLQGRQDLDLVGFGAHLYDRMLAETRGHGAHTVLLSSELLMGGAHFSLFCRMLRRDFDDIRPVLYVRNPKHRYRSQLQQGAKGGSFRSQISLLSIEVDRAGRDIGTPLALLPYIESSVDRGWNVIDDFWAKVLGGAPLPEAEGPRANTADSVELTLVLLLVARFYRRDNPDCDTGHEISERISYLRKAALALDGDGGPSAQTKRLVFSDVIEARIAAASRPDQDWIDRYMQDPHADCGTLPQDGDATRIFTDVDELFRHTEKNTDACMALLDGLMVWLDTVIAQGNRSRRTVNLRTALHAACHHLKALRT